jgi:N,N-dimethylformamidase beta subunit-like, C-terminal
MTTAHSHINLHGAALRRCIAVAVATLAVCLSGAMPQPATGGDHELDGRAPTTEQLQPSVQAAFQLQSYAPRTRASLVLFNSAPGITLQLFHAGPELVSTYGDDEMQGVPVTLPTAIGAARNHRIVPIQIGNWPTGLYFARLTAADGRVGFAPFVVRPSHLGEHRVAVVLPTMTWQAFLADSDLASAPAGSALARAYDLIVFPGHHEYVTTREYDLVVGYRDRGGHLAFLSANNFFWQIVERGNVMRRTQQWRDLGRPEAALVGAQYRGNDLQTGDYIVRDTAAAPWLFADTGLTDGSQFCCGGIEIDKTASSSPRGVKVLAEIPNLFGPGFTAQMTYYETANGAEVFAAGAFSLAASVDLKIGGQLVAKLWAHMAQPNRALLTSG